MADRWMWTPSLRRTLSAYAREISKDRQRLRDRESFLLFLAIVVFG